MSTKLVWDQEGQKLYETGADRGVLFPYDNGAYGAGVAWNGLINVNEAPSGAEPTALWADNRKYLELTSAEEFGFTIEAYMSPEEFDACDGSMEIAPGVYAGQQNRKSFGFSYRTLIGNDADGTDYGYKIHLVYGAKAKPSSRDNATVNDSPEAMTLSWECSTTPVDVPGGKPTAHLVFNSTKVAEGKMAALEAILYGSDSAEPKMPTINEIIELMKDSAAG